MASAYWEAIWKQRAADKRVRDRAKLHRLQRKGLAVAQRMLSVEQQERERAMIERCYEPKDVPL